MHGTLIGKASGIGQRGTQVIGDCRRSATVRISEQVTTVALLVVETDSSKVQHGSPPIQRHSRGGILEALASLRRIIFNGAVDVRVFEPPLIIVDRPATIIVSVGSPVATTANHIIREPVTVVAADLGADHWLSSCGGVRRFRWWRWRCRDGGGGACCSRGCVSGCGCLCRFHRPS